MGRHATETKVLPDLPSGGHSPAVMRVPPRIEIERLRAFSAHGSNRNDELENAGGQSAQRIHPRDSEAGNLNFNQSADPIAAAGRSRPAAPAPSRSRRRKEADRNGDHDGEHDVAFLVGRRGD